MKCLTTVTDVRDALLREFPAAINLPPDQMRDQKYDRADIHLYMSSFIAVIWNALSINCKAEVCRWFLDRTADAGQPNWVAVDEAIKTRAATLCCIVADVVFGMPIYIPEFYKSTSAKGATEEPEVKVTRRAAEAEVTEIRRGVNGPTHTRRIVVPAPVVNDAYEPEEEPVKVRRIVVEEEPVIRRRVRKEDW